MSDAGDNGDPFDSYLDLSQLVGVWADSTVVHRERDACAVDFIRVTPVSRERILVARVLVSPAVAVELRDGLDDAWRAYPGWSMPEEDQ
jgi:hypothetical protein